jgi:hypothetical protein
MSLKEFAAKADLSVYDFECILHGNSSLVLQNRYNISMGEIDVFISQNIASEAFAKLMGASVEAIQALGTALGRDGRLGFFIAFLLKK